MAFLSMDKIIVREVLVLIDPVKQGVSSLLESILTLLTTTLVFNLSIRGFLAGITPMFKSLLHITGM